jgi:hypothetical protein
MLTLAAYPVFQDKKAPRPCTLPPTSLPLTKMLTLCSLRCPPVRGMSRRTDRFHRIHIDEIFQACRQAQKASGWSWYGRWSGTTIRNLKFRWEWAWANSTKSTTTVPTSISVRNSTHKQFFGLLEGLARNLGFLQQASNLSRPYSMTLANNIDQTIPVTLERSA